MMSALAFVVALAAAAAPSVDASKLTLSPPARVVELNTGKLKGNLSRLSWSPDGRQLYLQTAERDAAGNIRKLHHYLLALDGKAPKGVDVEPPWSASYWAWKSAQAAPGLPGFKIALDQQQKRMSSTSIPTGGNMAKGGTDPGTSAGADVSGFGTGDAFAAAFQTQIVNVITLTLKGDVVGEFVNAPLVPGLTWGWGPSGSDLVAFVDQKGNIQIMDDQGRKQEIDAKSAVLPAWTDDGTRLAYLEKTGRNKAVLRVVDVKQP